MMKLRSRARILFHSHSLIVAKFPSQLFHIVPNLDLPPVVLIFSKNLGIGKVFAQVQQQVNE